MKNILVVLGSARRGRVADSIAAHITAASASRSDTSITIADLAALNLPFFDNERTPSDPEYVVSDPRVAEWSKLVSSADAVILAVSEYNHTLSAIMKNGLDTLFAEWNNKPTGVVAYGWYGGSNALVTLHEIAKVIKIDIKAETELFFTKDIAPDGGLSQDSEALQKIGTVLDALK
jgi:NAD(P)H-dependent FMN reductase